MYSYGMSETATEADYTNRDAAIKAPEGRPLMSVEVVLDATEAGNPHLRAVDQAGTLLAGAIYCTPADRSANGTWEVFIYAGGPNGQVSAYTEADAREWVQWLGEQLVAREAAR